MWHDWDPDELVAFARAAGAEFDVAYRPVSPPEGDPMRRPVHELTLAELRAHYGLAPMKGDVTTPVHLPVLDEVVAWAAAQGGRLKCVLVDIKIPAAHKACAKTLLDALEAAIGRHRPSCRFLLMTPVLSVLQALRELAPARSRTFDVEIKPGFAPDADDVDPRSRRTARCGGPCARATTTPASAGRASRSAACADGSSGSGRRRPSRPPTRTSPRARTERSRRRRRRPARRQRRVGPPAAKLCGDKGGR